MRVFIAGIDGYLGWPLAQTLALAGHGVGGTDNSLRRMMVRMMGSVSAIPIAPMQKRAESFQQRFGKTLFYRKHDVTRQRKLREMLTAFKPDCIVNLAQVPSAPWSMASYHKCMQTVENNIKTTLNLLWLIRELELDCHLVMIGTAGEYGTPEITIPEGKITVGTKPNGDPAEMYFPRSPGSLYHASKVSTSTFIEMACRFWGVRATDIMQGVVYGTWCPAMGTTPGADNDLALVARTRFDFDQAFGTAVNRFVAQAIIGHPLTKYGKGLQRRSFLPLRDSMECLKLIIENPPANEGDYRIVNQYEGIYTIDELADRVAMVAHEKGLVAKPTNIENPRIELEEHSYEMERKVLDDLGYKPTSDMTTELTDMFTDLLAHRERIVGAKSAIKPTYTWR